MVTVYLVNAFTLRGKGGNPAGVCLDADGLSESEMQAIAAKVGYSETAFVQKPSSKMADLNVRFFTPTREVDLCGHATIATFYLLTQQGRLKPGTYFQETKAGTLKVEIPDDRVFMYQQLPKRLGTIPNKEVEECLDTKLAEFPVEIVSTGEPTIIACVPSLDALLAMRTNFERIRRFEERHYGGLVYVFTLQTTNSRSSAHGRMFAPVDGINEESATGVANGALACYLFRNGLAQNHSYRSSGANMIFEQGYSMGSPS
ncbi:MAG TPA: PhzF family phenazine biosynthesis protein, partial [Candidatus Nanoarchaeia archaeon]|nr:PhzF family phenazine biosynthesis protein [Candidatus Nanoarchaeia archaeon]